MTTLNPPEAGVWYTQAQASKMIDDALVPYIETLRIIGDRLYDEALERDWCQEYDAWCDNVNRELPAGISPFKKLPAVYNISFSLLCTADQAKELETWIDIQLSNRGMEYTENYQAERQ